MCALFWGSCVWVIVFPFARGWHLSYFVWVVLGFFFREYSGGGLDGVGMSIGIFFVYGYISEIDEDDEICEMLHMSRFTCCVGHSRFHVEGAMVVGACLCLVLLYFDITGSCMRQAYTYMYLWWYHRFLYVKSTLMPARCNPNLEDKFGNLSNLMFVGLGISRFSTS
jgi:hypothetical protein